MKKEDLERQLRAWGFEREEGSKHDHWKSPTDGFRVWVPRHTEINKFTAKAILAEAAKHKK